jgi:hypothetical protein
MELTTVSHEYTHHPSAVALQVPPFLICKLFTQVFSFINVQLFNRYVHIHYLLIIFLKRCAVNSTFGLNCSLLLRRECCSFSNGEYVKAGLDELEHWCFWLTEEVSNTFTLFFVFDMEHFHIVSGF